LCSTGAATKTDRSVTIAGLTPVVNLAQQFDVAGNGLNPIIVDCGSCFGYIRWKNFNRKNARVQVICHLPGVETGTQLVLTGWGIL
jgi:hypothetical protein